MIWGTHFLTMELSNYDYGMLTFTLYHMFVFSTVEHLNDYTCHDGT